MTTKIINSEMKACQLGDRYAIFPIRNQIAVLQDGKLARYRKLEPRVMDVLVRLMAARGSIVSKQELVDRVWEGYGGGEEGLMQAVSKLRRALGDDARSPEVIETIVKRGYRLLLPVTPYSLPQSDRPEPVRAPADGIGDPVPTPVAAGLIGFVERLTRPRFLLAFLLFSFVCIAFIGVLGQLVFWLGVMIGAI
jgi:DNA-binding winged helix-turn-helix (wHTH) protein